MIRLSQLVGQRVLARDGGQLLGSLRRLMLDPSGESVSVVQIEGAAVAQAALIDWAEVAAIGPDAVMIESADALREPRDDAEQRLCLGKVEMLGKLVLDEGGDALGPLEDLEFDESSGRITSIHVPGQAVPVERVIALGPDALIVPALAAVD